MSLAACTNVRFVDRLVFVNETDYDANVESVDVPAQFEEKLREEGVAPPP